MRSHAPVLMSLLLSVCVGHPLAAAESKPVPAGLSVTQIVDKHVAARGGLQAWHAVQTLSISGKLDAGTGDSAARSAKLARQGAGASARRAERAAAAAAEAAKARDEAAAQVAPRGRLRRQDRRAGVRRPEWLETPTVSQP